MINEIQQKEKELHYFIREDTDEFRDSMIDTILHIDSDPEGAALIEIHRDGTYDVYTGRKADFSTDDDNFRFQFSYISPLDVTYFGDLHINQDGLWEDDNGITYEDDEDLLDEVKYYIFIGYCNIFNYEWVEFLEKFSEWHKRIRTKQREGAKA